MGEEWETDGERAGKGQTKRGEIPSERREMSMEKLGKGGKTREKIIYKRISLCSVIDIYINDGRKL